MKVSGVACDLEGTLVDSERAHHWGWIRAAAEIGVIIESPERALEIIPHFSGGPDEPIIQEIYSLRPEQNEPPTPEEVRWFLARKWQHYDELLPEIDLRPRPGFFEVYGRLRASGIPVTIGTATDLVRALELLRHSGLDRIFRLHEIVLPTCVKRLKPVPDCFIETARRMGIHPRNQLVCEDSPRGVISGVAAGSVVIALPVYGTPMVEEKLRKAGAWRIYPDWRQIDLDALFRDLEALPE